MSSIQLYPLSNRLMAFPYTAKYANKLKFWDRSPLCIILYTDDKHFIGANIHYLRPELRPLVMERAKQGELLFPKNIVHKYLQSNAALFTDYEPREWGQQVNQTRGDFVNREGRPIKPDVVWNDPKIYAAGTFHAFRIDTFDAPEGARTYYGDSNGPNQ